MLAKHCSEFLIHAADVEGLCQGIDEHLVKSKYLRSDLGLCLTPTTVELGEWVTIPTTYAGGAKCGSFHEVQALGPNLLHTAVSDLELVDHLSGGEVDLTYGR